MKKQLYNDKTEPRCFAATARRFIRQAFTGGEKTTPQDKAEPLAYRWNDRCVGNFGFYFLITLKMAKKTFISLCSMILSLLSYFYAKETGRDAVPYLMAGGFFGAIVGEAIVEIFSKNDPDNDKNLTT